MKNSQNIANFEASVAIVIEKISCSPRAQKQKKNKKIRIFYFLFFLTNQELGKRKRIEKQTDIPKLAKI